MDPQKDSFFRSLSEVDRVSTNLQTFRLPFEAPQCLLQYPRQPGQAPVALGTSTAQAHPKLTLNSTLAKSLQLVTKAVNAYSILNSNPGHHGHPSPPLKGPGLYLATKPIQSLPALSSGSGSVTKGFGIPAPSPGALRPRSSFAMKRVSLRFRGLGV